MHGYGFYYSVMFSYVYDEHDGRSVIQFVIDSFKHMITKMQSLIDNRHTGITDFERENVNALSDVLATVRSVGVISYEESNTKNRVPDFVYSF